MHPTKQGLKIPEMFDAALDGKLRALWVIGEDIVQTDPNTKKVIKALEATDLVIVQELFMTETAKYADIILPGASFLEKSGTFTNGERRVQAVRQVVAPQEGAKADGQIIVDIMNKMGYAQPDYTPEGMLEEISQIVPFFAGITWDRLGTNGLQWPVAKDGTDTQILHTSDFKRGKGYFEFHDWIETQELVSHAKEYPYILTTNRELEHYNCGAMTRRTANEQLLKDDYLMINPEDAAKHFISEGDYVCLESPRGKVDVKAKITDQVKSGVVSTTFHFPEIMINNITGDVHDSEAKCPDCEGSTAINGKYQASSGWYFSNSSKNLITTSIRSAGIYSKVGSRTELSNSTPGGCQRDEPKRFSSVITTLFISATIGMIWLRRRSKKL